MSPKKYKWICDECQVYKYDVHSYFDADDTVYILCPDCMKKNKKLILNWKHEPIEREDKHVKKQSDKKKRTVKSSSSKNNKDSGNTKNGNKDSGQLLHNRVSRRKRDTKQSEYRPGTRKVRLI